MTHSANEWRDQGDTSLGTGDGLAEAEQESEVAVDTLSLELAGCLDTLPSGSDLDQDTLLLDTDGLVKSDELLGLFDCRSGVK